MEVDQPAFHLRCELLGHHEDVRSIAVGEIGIITGSRDTTIKIWADDAPDTCSLLNTLAGNKSYVGAVTYAPPGFLPGLENGAVISGSFDGVVMVFDAVSGAPVHTYKGHQYQVTAVALLPTGDIVSASVDATIKLWREGRDKPAGVISGHEGPVLCLAVTEGGELLSGSGDKTIKRWRGTQCVATYKGHTDSVRGVAILPGVGFVSGSHDCSLRVWSLEGDVLAELLGHSAIIYHVAATDSGLIASGSEDNTMRVWNAGGSCLQVIEHPGCVWATAFTARGELVSGCSDAVGRVWSTDPARKADAEVSAAFSRLLEERKAAAAQAAADSAAAGQAGGGAGGGAGALPPGVKVVEAHELMAPGSKDGETKLVREADGSVSAYGWSLGGGAWEKIGTVVDAPQAGAIDTAGGRWYMGREWDRVFDVEMDSGLKLKLALDNGENPYLVADRFLEQHDLPQEFKEQIVQFILQNTGGPQQSLGDLPITGGFCDPFTGGGTGETSAPPPRPAPAPVAPTGPISITGGFCDPFTGGASSSGGSRGGAGSSSSSSQLPARVYLLFDGPPPAEGLRKKLVEFNAVLQSSPELGPAALITELEAAAGGALDQLLASLPAAAAGAASFSITPEQTDLLSRLLRWPAGQLFPALDIARCLALHPAAAQQLAAAAGSMNTPATGGLSGALAAAAVSGHAPALQMGLRLVTNCFKDGTLRSWVVQERELILDGFAGAGSGPAGSKAVRLGLATVLLNYIVAGAGNAGADEAAGMQVLSCVEDLLRACPAEEVQAAHRAVVALGSLLVGPGAPGFKGVAVDLGLSEALQRWRGAQGELGAAVDEVLGLLK